MNKFIFLVLAATLMTAQPSFAGNSVGNGGNTSPPDLVSEEQIREVLNSARRMLFSFFNAVSFFKDHADYSYLRRPEYNALLANRSSIFEALQTARIQPNYDSACIDDSGQEVDANSNQVPSGYDEPSICVSVFRLKEKLTQDDYRQQILALVAHEFSHRIGYTEEHAQALQLAVLMDVRRMIYGRTPRGYDYYWPTDADFLEEVTWRRVLIASVQEAFINVHKYSEAQLIDLMMEFSYQYSDPDYLYPGGLFYHFRLLNLAEQAQLMSSVVKETAVHAGTCLLYAEIPDPIIQSTCNGGFVPTANYTESFKGQSAISVAEFDQVFRVYPSRWQYHLGSPFPIPLPFQIRKISSRADIERELAEILDGSYFLLHRVKRLSSMAW